MFPRHSDRLWLRSRSIPEDAVGNTPKVRKVSERRSAPRADRPESERDPPAGGSHEAPWLPCAAYDEPVRNEYAVHALEHGAIWITYQPDLDAAAIDDLEGYARRSEVIVSHSPGLDSPIVLSAWGRQLRLDVGG